MEVQIILPPCADGEYPLDHGLVTLTEAICKATGEESGYGLGGRYGYGENFENSVFMMHRFCWCERTDCKWCDDDACGCPNPEPKFFVDGKEVTSDEHWEANKHIVGECPHDVAEYGTPEYEAADALFKQRCAERDRRLRMVHQDRIHTCAPVGMMANRARSEDYGVPQRAPNFWHKPSGLRVWWYKWIGRDMEVLGAEDVDLNAIFTECLASLRTSG
jgi:hypothetical protein